MRKIKDVLRLKLDAKLSHQQIAAALGISNGVVNKYVGLAAHFDGFVGAELANVTAHSGLFVTAAPYFRQEFHQDERQRCRRQHHR
jgi:hypothetical protein